MQTLQISKAELLQIRSQCKNTFNWSDFGHWQGRGAAPNCSANIIKNNHASLTISWPNEESVEKWHAMKDKEARNTGYALNFIIGLASLYTGFGAASLTKVAKLKGAYASAAGLATNTVADVAKGEALAKVLRVYPRKGDRMVIEFKFETREYAQVGQKSVFVITSKSTHYRADGSIADGAGTNLEPLTVKYGGEHFPFDLAHQIVASRMRNHTVVFK